MEMHQLEYVLAVAEYHNFTRAAEEIKTSQSSLSQQISKLENELGINLFLRTTRSVKITPAGKEFIKHAKRIMLEVVEARRCIHEYVSYEKGELTLGVIPIVGHYRIPKMLSSFKKKFPRVTLKLIESQCSELFDMLHFSKIDGAFVFRDNSYTYVQYHHLVKDPMVVVTSKTHPLSIRNSVSLKELKNETFIVPPPSSGLHHDFIRACQHDGFEPDILLTCSSVKTMLCFVHEELGITVLPSSVVAAMDWGLGLSTVLLIPAIDEDISLATKNIADSSPILKEFLKLTAQWAK